MRKLFTLLLFVPLLGCTPKPPTPTPTPTPEPPPPAYDTARLLRPDGSRIKTNAGEPVLLNMGVQCCRSLLTPTGEINTLWPLISESAMDYFHERGLTNAYHFRMGPFYTDTETEVDWVEYGGPYAAGTLEWNPAFWDKVRALVQHAYDANAYVEVVVIDTWGCKYSQWGNKYVPWPQDAIDACGRTWHPEHERYARKVVSELGAFTNVIWSLDNEGENISDWQQSWYLKLRDVIRDEEKGVIHMIGTSVSGVRDQVDFSITHERTPLLAPIDGRWTLNNERNPSYSPAEEARIFSDARARGLTWALWRNGMDDAAFEDTLARFKAVIESTTPKCLAGVCPPENRYIRAKEGSHNYLDSTMRCSNRRYCEASTGIPGTVDCALGPEGTEQRIACELEHSPGCLRWFFKTPANAWERCMPEQHPIASCDHYDRWIEWEGPYTGHCTTNDKGEPIAGNEMVPHGKTSFRACDSLGVACSNELEVDR